MNWSTLFSTMRTGDPENKIANPDRVRTSFLRDYDRVVFSSPFRRLQNKTQVFPLPGAVFVHNRLTHSLEVASVGRSLGKVVGNALAEKHGFEEAHLQEFYLHELQSVIATACLAHDIGNPPFGHSGEDAIRNFFRELSGESKSMLSDHLSKNQWKDFERFEGNANALRVLTHSFNEIEPGGYKLTYATLASIVKYPCRSTEGFDKASGFIATKKSGFFDSEVQTFQRIAAHLGIVQKDQAGHVFARHPFVYLTEAADDICYRVIDLEDAHRLHIVSLEKIEELFLPFFEKSEGFNTADYLKKKLSKVRDDNQKVQIIRAAWIGLMVEKLSKIFLQQEASLLAGTLETDLMKCLPERDQLLIEAINEYSYRYIYNYRSVVEIEIAGFNIMGGLLKEFVHAVLKPSSQRSSKLLQIIPPQFVITKFQNNLYKDIQSVVDFISGMTDLYALDLYRKITGITIPELR
ncbi:MAG: deoxyguanosinetriphosphate triphosphohydrolase [Bacteroidetes bacterium]|nr:deoxyguanosinetriphosphate triphosphohydrolase [Bacteroidota bacterium]